MSSSRTLTLLKLQILLLTLIYLAHGRKYHEIKTKFGKIRGINMKNALDNLQYTTFYAIPYAEKITQQTKFRDSKPIKPWPNQIVNATSSEGTTGCYAIDQARGSSGQLDCLTMDVYVPRGHTEESMTTIIYIHSDVIINPTNNPAFSPDYFLREGVILVKINYRLFLFGFLNTGTAEAPGNMGLKDQNKAIKFYIEVIAEAVGGDPQKITLFGSHLGSSYVAMHMMSPLSRGLFQRAILSYGTSTDLWAYNSDPEEMIEQIATFFQLKITDPEELGKELSEWHSDEIVSEFQRLNERFFQRRTESKTYTPIAEFTPSLEKKVNGCEQFLPGHVHDLMMNGDFERIPVMVGINAFGQKMNLGWFYVYKRMRNWSYDNPGRITMDVFQFMFLPPGVDENFRDIEYFIIDLIEYYTGIRNLNPNPRQMIAMFSSLLNTFHYWIWINTYRHFNQDVYAYSYAFDHTCNIYEDECYNFSEIPYLFYNSKKNKIYKKGTSDWNLMNLMTKSFTNFAKYGNPTPADSGLPKWEKYNKNREVFVIMKQNSYMEPTDKLNWISDLCWLKEQMNDKLQDHIDKFELC